MPVNKRVSDNEAGITQVGDRVSNLEGQVQKMANQMTELDSRLNQANAKADRALESLQRLKPERKMVLNFTEGALFAANSVRFSDQAKRDIDSFLSDVKGHANEGGNLIFVVAGHTDSSGSASYNYELSKRRADGIAGYIVTEGKIEPTRVMAVGYGERAPVADNKTAAGRVKNRRVEILVYQETVTVGLAGRSAPKPQEQSTVR